MRNGRKQRDDPSNFVGGIAKWEILVKKLEGARVIEAARKGSIRSIPLVLGLNSIQSEDILYAFEIQSHIVTRGGTQTRSSVFRTALSIQPWEDSISRLPNAAKKKKKKKKKRKRDINGSAVLLSLADVVDSMRQEGRGEDNQGTKFQFYSDESLVLESPCSFAYFFFLPLFLNRLDFLSNPIPWYHIDDDTCIYVRVYINREINFFLSLYS